MRRSALALGLCLAVFAVFAGSLGHPFHYDDEHSLVQNPHIRTLDLGRLLLDPGAFSVFAEARMYRPAVVLAHAVNYRLGGYEPWGYHLFNVLVHLLNTLLVWRVGRRLGLGAERAVWAALCFGLHPLVSEPVNYISSRSSLLAAAGALLAVGGVLGLGPKRGWPALIGGTLLGLGAKAVAVGIAPLALVLLWHRGQARSQWPRWAVPAGAGLAYGLWTYAIIAGALGEPLRGPAEQGATQTKAVVFYLWTLVVPTRLSVEPQFFLGVWGQATVWAALALSGSLVLVVWRAYRWQPLLAWGVVWAGVFLLPVLVVPLHVLVNEHRLYVPLAGLSWGLAALWPGGRAFKAAGVVLLGLWTVLAAARTLDWRSEERLWADAAAKGPHMARPWVNLGKAYLNQGRWQEAIAASRRGLALDPNLALAHYNIATAYLEEEKWDAAAAGYRRALEIRPDLVQAHNNLGNVRREQERYADAVAAYRQALALGGEAAPLWHNIATAYLGWGQADSAAVAYGRALQTAAPAAESYRGLVKAYLASERLQSARDTAAAALQRWPRDRGLQLLAGDADAAAGRETAALGAYRRAGLGEGAAHGRLADRILRRSNWPRAAEQYRLALERGAASEAVYVGLGRALEGMGEHGAALEAWRTAARLPDAGAQPYAFIGRFFLRQGKGVEAAAALARAVQLDGDGPRWQFLLGQAQQRAGRLHEAAAAYQRYIAWPGADTAAVRQARTHLAEWGLP